MCGVVGEIRFDGRPVPVSGIERMNRAQRDRGPDGHGLYVSPGMALGHRRLKIIDLSERGRQPMHDPALGLSLVFNGCIYNYRSLRAELIRRGYRFFSDSDSEVILKAYDAWGEHCVEHFNGMFAFVIHERDTGRTFMARDRLGIKPLYYIKTPACLRFASTLPPLLTSLVRTPAIDPVALHHYLSFHAVVPAPRTLFESIRKLEPGTTRTFERSGTSTHRTYWRPVYGPVPGEKVDEDSLIEELLHVLRTAVRRRTEADVPVGVLLSGGVDSSLITALLAESAETSPETFSIGFEANNDEDGDEFRYSDIIAEVFGTHHHRIHVDGMRLMDHLPDCIAAMSEPMVSHDNIGFYLLGKSVAERMKVVQSGQGADELFGGYHWYQKLPHSSDPVADYARAFFDRDQSEYREVVTDSYLVDDHSRKFVMDHFARPGADDPVDKALRLDTHVMLVDDPVKRVDNMTMAWSLEARVPFLDHEVVEFSARVPPELKLRDGGKYLLRQAARRVIPAEVIDRPKGYFPVPALKYPRGEVLEYMRTALTGDAARQRGLFRQAYVETLLADPDRHITPLRGSKLWQLATLELWLQAHGV